jgi:hypothetical protein
VRSFRALLLLVVGIAGAPSALAGARVAATDPETDLPRARPPASPAAPSLDSVPPRVTLVLFDVHELVKRHRDALLAEVSGLLGQAGIEASWLIGRESTVYGAGPAREIGVIVLRQPPATLTNADTVMGLVPRIPGRQPVWIFVENIKRAMSVSPSQPRLQRQTRELSIAAGRVVVHELVHALVPDAPHALEGLMKHSLRRADLVGTRPFLAPAVAAAMRTALLRAEPDLPAPAEAEAPALARGTPAAR